ncbi:hypothetical protein BKA93DRAFT_823725 [Sparassis latifolia]
MTNRAVVFRKFAETGVWSRKCGGGLGDTQGARSLLAAGGGGGHAESLVPRGAAVIAIVDPVAALPGFLVGAVTVGHAGRRIQRPSLTLRATPGNAEAAIASVLTRSASGTLVTACAPTLSSRRAIRDRLLLPDRDILHLHRPTPAPASSPVPSRIGALTLNLGAIRNSGCRIWYLFPPILGLSGPSRRNRLRSIYTDCF